MSGQYFNFSRALAKTGGERRGFLNNWWWINANDPRWAPPYYPAMGRLLRALQTAQEQGWHHLTIGPIPERSLDAVNFLVHHGAQPQQKYQVFSYEF